MAYAENLCRVRWGGDHRALGNNLPSDDSAIPLLLCPPPAPAPYYSTQTVLAERSSYTYVDKSAFADGVSRKVCCYCFVRFRVFGFAMCIFSFFHDGEKMGQSVLLFYEYQRIGMGMGAGPSLLQTLEVFDHGGKAFGRFCDQAFAVTGPREHFRRPRAWSGYCGCHSHR